MHGDYKLLKAHFHVHALEVIRTACACVRCSCLGLLTSDNEHETVKLGLSSAALEALVERYQREEVEDPMGKRLWRRLAARPEFARLLRMSTTAKAASRSDVEQEAAAESYIETLSQEFDKVGRRALQNLQTELALEPRSKGPAELFVKCAPLHSSASRPPPVATSGSVHCSFPVVIPLAARLLRLASPGVASLIRLVNARTDRA